jgi:hypothetical protein
MSISEYSDERFLAQVNGPIIVTDNAIDVRRQPILVASDQDLESVIITL